MLLNRHSSHFTPVWYIRIMMLELEIHTLAIAHEQVIPSSIMSELNEEI